MSKEKNKPEKPRQLALELLPPESQVQSAPLVPIAAVQTYTYPPAEELRLHIGKIKHAVERLNNSQQTELAECTKWLNQTIEKTEAYLEANYGADRKQSHLKIERAHGRTSFVPRLAPDRISLRDVKNSWKAMPSSTSSSGRIQTIFEEAASNFPPDSETYKNLMELQHFVFTIEEKIVAIDEKQNRFDRIQTGLNDQLLRLQGFLADENNKDFVDNYLPIYEPDNKNALQILSSWINEGIDRIQKAHISPEADTSSLITQLLIQSTNRHLQTEPEISQVGSRQKCPLFEQCRRDVKGTHDELRTEELLPLIDEIEGFLHEFNLHNSTLARATGRQ